MKKLATVGILLKKKKMKKLLLIFTLLNAVTLGAFSFTYTKRHILIPMRDGVRLYTEIYEPTDNPQAPILMMRTPYALSPYNDDTFNSKQFGLDSIYLNHGYILVRQNVRGTYLSEGHFEQSRPYLPNKKGGETDEASDSWDTVDWLLTHCHTNGCVGVKGTSYPGFYALMAARSGHPAIKAASPQAPVNDWFMGDDIHHNGALMLMDSYSFGASFFRMRTGPSSRALPPLAPVDTTVNVFYHRPITDILKPVLEKGSLWTDIVNHPNYDGYWQSHCSTHKLKGIEPAVMIVGGLYDAEDNFGAWNTWRQIKRRSPRTPLFLVEAPWYHHAWGNGNYQHLDGAWFGKGTAAYFINQIEYPFFAYYLENKGERPSPVTVLPSAETREEVMKDRSVVSQWLHLNSWPPRGVHHRRIELEGGTVMSDPQNPVPYYNNIRSRHRDRSYMAADQRFATQRKDVLTFVRPAIQDTLHLMGPVKVRLTLNTSATDLDVIVKLIDVRPDGYEMLVRGEVMPARFRHSFLKPEPIIPGKNFSLSFSMPDIAHVLLPGHRLSVQIQYSCFPLIAVNPQTFLTNPYKAAHTDYQKARVTLLGDGESWVELTTWQ